MQEDLTHTTPNHIGLILDGNRRWARGKGLPTLEGHRAGYDNLKTIARAAFEQGVNYVSAYIFSTENWNRTKEEVDYLMNLAMRIATKDARQLIKEGVRIMVLGAADRVDPKLLKIWRQTEEDSKNNTKGTLALCFNYGGARELTDAVRQIVSSGVPPEQVTPELIEANLYHPEVPVIDLMIRTSGEQRLSGFMLWRMAYAEMYFSQLHWPAFTTVELKKAITSYAARQRRFGGN